jgi:hypothetical protein
MFHRCLQVHNLAVAIFSVCKTHCKNATFDYPPHRLYSIVKKIELHATTHHLIFPTQLDFSCLIEQKRSYSQASRFSICLEIVVSPSPSPSTVAVAQGVLYPLHLHTFLLILLLHLLDALLDLQRSLYAGLRLIVLLPLVLLVLARFFHQCQRRLNVQCLVGQRG